MARKMEAEPRTPKEFAVKLMTMERFGSIAVREFCNQAADEWKQDCDRLIELADILMKAVETAWRKEDDELTGTYLYLYYDLQDVAKDNLNPAEYSRFCRSMEKRNVRVDIFQIL